MARNRNRNRVRTHDRKRGQRAVLASGENGHFASGENDQFQSDEKCQSQKPDGSCPPGCFLPSRIKTAAHRNHRQEWLQLHRIRPDAANSVGSEPANCAVH